jgi:hypothetical protein
MVACAHCLPLLAWKESQRAVFFVSVECVVVASVPLMQRSQLSHVVFFHGMFWAVGTRYLEYVVWLFFFAKAHNQGNRAGIFIPASQTTQCFAFVVHGGQGRLGAGSTT